MTAWGDLIATSELVDLQIVHVWGAQAEFIDRDSEPEEWTSELATAARSDGTRFMARAAFEISGPGGEISVDGVATFENQSDWDSLDEELVARFYVTVGIPAIVPTVRATYEDLRVRLGLEDAPRFGLIKIPEDKVDEALQASGAGQTGSDGASAGPTGS